MSDWAYVAIAYTVVWGALALYALLLARRVWQAHRVERELQKAIEADDRLAEQDGKVWDTPPAP